MAGLAAILLVAGTVAGPGAQPAAADPADCTPLAGFTNCRMFTFTNPGANQTFRVPPGVTEVDARLWGAGGGGAASTHDAATPGGGAGAFVAGVAPATGGETWNITIGWGGYNTNPDLSPFGNGGVGGAVLGGIPHGSTGGGLGALWTGEPFASEPLLVAGAGGGAASGSTGGGGGGGAAGASGQPGQGGVGNAGGGSPSEGGAGAPSPGCAVVATAGSAYAGGSGAGGGEYQAGGGGGAGRFGGGGGGCGASNGTGGGGSSYIAPTVTAPRSEAGASGAAPGVNAQPGGMGDPVYGYAANVGIGGMTNALGQAGGAGFLVLQWVMPAPVITAPADGTTSSEQSPTITGTAGPGNTVTVTDGAGGPTVCTAVAAADGTWTCTPTTPLAEGSHPLVATQTNDFADVYPASETVTYVVDVTPPAAPAITGPATSTNTSTAVSGTGEAGSSVTVRTTAGTVVCGPVTVPSSGSWSCTPTSPLALGGNPLIPTATDAYDNAVSGPTYTVTIVEPPPPPPAPPPPVTPSAPPAPAPAVPPVPRPRPTTEPEVTPSPSPPPVVEPAEPDEPEEPEPEPADPDPAGRPLTMNVQMRAGELQRGQVGRFDTTLGPNPSSGPVTLTLSGSVNKGFIYRSVQVDPEAECAVRTTEFACVITLDPGATAQVTIRLLADELNAPNQARQQLSVSSSDPSMDTSTTVTADVEHVTDTEAFAAAITSTPGPYLLLLVLLLYALAATVAEKRESGTSEPRETR
ncbi:hypothetical protein Bcav_4114 [Beutenbergia cavernae DSM 12333]|uniref:Bacterial Ig-like domain-containing protein n=1 Tax=Beutenbergia cavernae (strain ATCC BAA-8 / DSM 12333 / CCUG 43141 / JCM 11478 / NBRC 16432 / NCIMB 13614 / HKI 0122) TaxID=471853 RepID=C5C5Z6_BEUC1|nr:hypothetical protein Bcav_4114 [Beutenbergia cavernae DSM 12333]